MVNDKIRAIPGFPAPLATLVQHLILSHHGSLEFGSPALPQIPEAIALHFIDDLDSKMASMRATLELSDSGAPPNTWTERNPALRRALLRAKPFQEYRGPASPSEKSPLAAADSERKN